MGWRNVLWVALVAATLWFLYMVRGILLPFLLSFLVAILLEPLIAKLRSRGWSKGAAIFSVFSVFLAIVLAAGVWLGPKLGAQLYNLQAEVTSLADQVLVTKPTDNYFLRWNPVVEADPATNNSWIDRTLETYRDTLDNLGLPSTRHAILERFVEPRKGEIGKGIEEFFGGFLGMASSLASKLLLLIFVPLITLSLLFDMENYRRRSLTWIPPNMRRSVADLSDEIGQVFIKYLHGAATGVLLYMAIMALLLSILGAPYGVLLGIVAGAIYLMPYLNVLINSTMIFLITGLSQRTDHLFLHFNSSWAFAGVITLAYLVVHFIYDSFVYQMLVGKSVGLNPIISIFVTLSGGALFGLVGMIIAFPLAGAAKVILDRLINYTTKPQDMLHLPAVPLRHRRSTA
ncbi:MAG: AI-2E family transporter [Armatimonadetes bacterium]|nr:AI-2E family transporter [Armatimonadota bacterium]